MFQKTNPMCSPHAHTHTHGVQCASQSAGTRSAVRHQWRHRRRHQPSVPAADPLGGRRTDSRSGQKRRGANASVCFFLKKKRTRRHAPLRPTLAPHPCAPRLPQRASPPSSDAAFAAASTPSRQRAHPRWRHFEQAPGTGAMALRFRCSPEARAPEAARAPPYAM